MKKQTIIVRIEISTLISSEGKINRRKMDRLAMVLTNLHNSGKHIMVVTSGAIVLGTEKLKFPTMPDSQLEMQAAASVGQAELIRWYQHSFDEYNQIVAQVLLERYHALPAAGEKYKEYLQKVARHEYHSYYQ
jgi:glutamate 5-kinase